MDWQTNMNRVIDYLEDNMQSEIDLNQTAKYAGYSVWEFQRIFALLTNTTVGSYIRKRKLSLAAQDIISGEEKIIDIAIKYGYEPTAFSRAFSQLFGISPSSARDEKAILDLHPKLNFSNTYEKRRTDYMNNMEKYSKRGYYVTFSIPPYFTRDMDKTSKWFVSVLGWFGGTITRNEKEEGIYGCVYDYPAEIFDIVNPQRGFYLFYGEPSKAQVGWMTVQQGGIDNLYKFVKENGWDKITEPTIEHWGGKCCYVTTIDGSILQFNES